MIPLTTKANIILDASKVDMFETCPSRYNFRYNHNKVVPLIEKNKSLDLGGLAHEGLAVYYNMLVGNKYHFDDRVQSALMKIRQVSADPIQSNADLEDVESLLTTIEQCLDYWRAEDENSFEVLAVEEPFAYTLFEDDSLRIIISGKIDLLINYHGIGRTSSYDSLPIDHKTFSRDSQVLRLNNQFINYCNAVNSNYLIVNRIGLHDPSAKKPKGSEEKFKRLPMSYDPIYISEWKDNLTKMILNEYIACIGTGYWPRKVTSCLKFNRLCEYYPICDSSGQDSKDQKLADLYVDGEIWDVTKNMTGDSEK